MGVIWSGSQHVMTLEGWTNFQARARSGHVLLLTHFTRLSQYPQGKAHRMRSCELDEGEGERKRKQIPGGGSRCAGRGGKAIYLGNYKWSVWLELRRIPF